MVADPPDRSATEQTDRLAADLQELRQRARRASAELADISAQLAELEDKIRLHRDRP
jgi:uncharacterized protein YfcZ (UPF0381/DUF406 family)